MLFVFAIHFLVFAWMAVKRRRLASTFAAGAFFLLFLAIAVRLWLPESYLLGIRAYWFLRIPAWILALAGLSSAWHQRQQKNQENG